ncbi:MAG: phosphotransferase [Nitrospinae bacterium]|nr:phosphotransferase [Nitrospinota bacterium]
MSYELKEIDLKEIEERYFVGILKEITGGSIQDISLTMLKGDASDRRYFRLGYKTELKAQSSKLKTSVIIMVLSSPSHSELPFINVQSHLRKCGMAVPEIYYYDEKKGFLFLEDCGDITLEEWVKGATSPSPLLIKEGIKGRSAAEYYKKAIDLLLNIQIKGSDKSIGDCVAFNLRFDVEKLMWELNFMIEHMIFGLLNKRMDNGDLDEVREYLLDLCQILSNQRQYLNHRDYHSRNIMVKDGDLRFLDFQDARMGPCQYDLCSLLRDSYTVLDNKLVDELIEYYISQKELIEGESIDRNEFRRIFDYMSIQRNLKAIGTFAYQKMAKGNDRYLKHIPPTLNYVKVNMDKYEAFAGLKKILCKYLPF